MSKFENILNTTNEINILYTLFSLLLCIIASFILKHVYETYGRSISNKTQLSSVLPLLACIVFLVISVVKSSLALSLGLVGALSIVRFRTPIKEPEELLYLFLSIGLGVGFAAGQILLTILVFISTVIVILISNRSKESSNLNHYNLVLEINSASENYAKKLDIILKEKFNDSEISFIKYDKIGEEKELYIFKINKFTMLTIDEINEVMKKEFGSNFNVNVYNSSTVF